ncbi:hypothetical protein [Hahella sp. HN01]|uniref:hypothetical protein n=1 Tax=Hahella sp. HN01 TaxID=2847262 RepID=UPI001C1EC989|nr:hypothetical protein [Hahella sp. HN01]MBU6954725.1 hypothetical protein [Hahella sp. HN01]
MSIWAIKLRKKRPCAPIGPDFAGAKLVSTSLSGSKLGVRLNRHMPTDGAEHAIFLAESYNVFHDELYTDVGRKDAKLLNILTRSWKFRGPAFVGYVAHVSLVVTVEKRNRSAGEISLFEPAEFERFLLSRLTKLYGSKIYDGRSEYEAPYQWKVHRSLSVPAVSYEIRPVMGGHDRSMCFAFPLDHQICVLFYFQLVQYEPGNLNDKDEMVSPDPLYALVREVINSVTLELSPSALDEYKKIKASYPESTLSERLQPLKWTTPEQDAQWKDKLRKEAEYRRQMEVSESELALEEKLKDASAEELTKYIEQAIEAEKKQSGDRGKG